MMSNITPDELVQMLKAVIEAGRATNWIKPDYLRIMENVATQIPKKIACQKKKELRAARSAAYAARIAAARAAKN